MNEEFFEMLERYRDGELSEEEVTRLRDALKNDSALRQDFIFGQMIEAACELEVPGAIEPQIEAPILFTKPTSRKRFAWHWAAAAALVVFAIGLGSGHGLFSGSAGMAAEEQEDDGVAVLSESVDAIWDGELDPEVGGILSPGNLKLKSGLAQIEFYSGARLVLEGPVELELVSPSRAICRSGKLRAQVPPHARGFTVLSPQFELVDLGTEFGIEVNKSGEAKVQVFDGEVEVYPPNGKRSPDELKRLLKGAGLNFDTEGNSAEAEPEGGSFPSFDDVKTKTRAAKKVRFENWKSWNESLRVDSRVVAHYDFENSSGSQLFDAGPSDANGSIVGSEWTKGRWPEKGALEFKRPGDRVRLDIPGEFENLTLTAWIRMDAQTGRYQSLLLTDRYEIGHVHWQFSGKGGLRFGVRLPSGAKKVHGSGYESPVLFSPRRIGTWNFVGSVYDSGAGEVRHYLNGREVSAEKMKARQSLQIGSAEIGNWGMPLRPQTNSRSIRNFVGRIDEMTIWNVALKDGKIRDIYRQTRP